MQQTITVQSDIADTPRVAQVRGMFDLTAEKTSHLTWHVHLPIEQRDWNIGLIVGASGCGKSTIARNLFPDADVCPQSFDQWVSRGSVVDAFPPEMSIKQIVALLSAVGFSSPPAWLRPFYVLSTGQQFRVSLALRLAYAPPDRCVVFDEYTSVVDRNVAQVGSAAVAKTVRRQARQFVAVTCHDDVEAWLQPDWVYRPAEANFQWRRLRRRPSISLDIVRCKASAWRLFAPHHYLSASLAKQSVCFLATHCGRPVAFSAWLPHMGRGPKSRREHRTVTLPDYQGVGIGNALSDFVASLWLGLGSRPLSTTTHPAMIQARVQSPNWRMLRRPSFAVGREQTLHRLRHATTRLTAGFEYVGPLLTPWVGRALLATHE